MRVIAALTVFMAVLATNVYAQIKPAEPFKVGTSRCYPET